MMAYILFVKHTCINTEEGRSDEATLEPQDLPCMYLAGYELDSSDSTNIATALLR